MNEINFGDTTLMLTIAAVVVNRAVEIAKPGFRKYGGKIGVEPATLSYAASFVIALVGAVLFGGMINVFDLIATDPSRVDWFINPVADTVITGLVLAGGSNGVHWFQELAGMWKDGKKQSLSGVSVTAQDNFAISSLPEIRPLPDESG